MLKKIAVGVVAAIAATAALSACSITGDKLTDPSVQTLRYEGGLAQGSKFKACLDPGSKMVSDDSFYSYPTSQRENVWDSDNKAADHGDLILTDKNGVAVDAKVKVDFTLNTDCAPITLSGHKYPGGALQAYHELIGKTRKAYFNKDGSYPQGWITAMDYYLSTPVQTFLRNASRGYTAEQLYQDPKVRINIQDKLQKELQAAVDSSTEGDISFYEVGTVTIQSLTPDGDFLQLFRDRQTASIQAQTAKDNARAKVIAAQADARVAREQAKVKQAEIAGYGSDKNYRCYLLAEKDLNCEQPSYVWGGSK